jgi:hypothetical protein
MALAEDRELQEFRDLIETPTEYADGFGWRTVFGAAFIGLIMMPGSIYLGLVAGQSMGPAAEWTTIILFTELARRSFQVLSKQEIYILYYIAGGLTSMIGVVALSGGAFAGLIWNQFLRSAAPGGLGDQVPNWVAPPPTSQAIVERTFWHADWVPAIMLMVGLQLLSRAAWLSFGYTLFRLTSDGEKLPFPLAPIAAQGATALAEASSKSETWRWRVFSIGTMIGLGFGLIYVGVPTISNVLLVKPVAILPIPWIDFTQGTERFLPGAPTGISTDLGTVFVGFVLPFWMVVGSACAAGVTMIVNPVLQKTGMLPTWLPGMETTRTAWAASIDVWLSFGIGTAFAVAFIGFYKIGRSWLDALRIGRRGIGFGKPPAGRGDVKAYWPLLLFFICTTGYVVLCRHLVPRFPIWFVILYGYFWTPLESYINARMIGLTGQFVGFPMIREATFIFSGYKGVDIWFAPIPLGNYGATAQKFREVELTGTKLTSVVKAEALMFPIMMVCSFIFWSFVWRLNPIPSVAYPYTQKFWDFQALQQWLWYSATTVGGSTEMFQRAIKPLVITGGLGFGLGAYGVLTRIGWPVMLIYGFIRGIGTFPHVVIPQLGGALLGRYYFAKRFGKQEWQRYTPVLAAGFSCGTGLVGMLAIAFALVSQSVSQMPF